VLVPAEADAKTKLGTMEWKKNIQGKLGPRVAPMMDPTRCVILLFGEETNDDNVLMFRIGWLIKLLI